MLVSKAILSGSVSGRMIKVTQTATLGDEIHTGQSDEKIIEEVWLWAVNSDTVVRKLTIEFGGVSSPDDLIEQNIDPEDGLVVVSPGLVLQGAGTPLVVTAFCDAANVVMLVGFINRISQG